MTSLTSGSRLQLLGKPVAGAFLALLLIITVISGWISLHEGTHRFLWALTETGRAELAAVIEATRAEPTAENMRQVSEELWGLAYLTSAQHIAESRLQAQGALYLEMPRLNQMLLFAHVLLAVFCMLFGTLQFWPAFRKRYRQTHRLIGTIYVITAPLAVLIAFAYLVVTPPHHIYDHLVAWIALWAFGLLAVTAIVMAVLAIRARRIHEHQAWMAISFASLMVAPLLRWNWIWLAWMFPGLDQETLNLVTMGAMLPECLLLAYALILVNRQYQNPMIRRPAHALAIRWAHGFRRLLPALYALAALLALTSAAYILMGQGMAGYAWYAELAPVALIAREHDVLQAQPLVSYGLAIGLDAGLLLGLHALGQLLQTTRITDVPERTRSLSRLVAVAALLAGLASFSIGWRIGLTGDNLWFSGGTMYTVNGVVIAGLALFHLLANLSGQLALMKESLVFLLAMLTFPALFLAGSWALHLIGLPPDYVAAGQGFVLPVGASTAPLFLAILHVVYNQATREHN